VSESGTGRGTWETGGLEKLYEIAEGFAVGELAHRKRKAHCLEFLKKLKEKSMATVAIPQAEKK